MLHQIVKKLLILISPLKRGLIETLPRITNDVKRSSHPINEPDKANTVTEGINDLKRRGSHEPAGKGGASGSQ
jgi:hypothetical protein